MDATVSLYQYQSALAQEVKSTPDAVSSQLVDKFQAMLANGPAFDPHGVQDRSVGFMKTVIDQQQEELRRVPADMLYSAQYMSSMSIQQAAQVSNLVGFETAEMIADTDIKMASVQASKDALQTLMKNQ